MSSLEAAVMENPDVASKNPKRSIGCIVLLL